MRNDFSKDKPLYTTGIVASMLDITPDRLRMYDSEGLITTHRLQSGQVKRRLYSQYDVEWLSLLRELLKTHSMSISSLKILLQILYLNPKAVLPKNEIGKILKELLKNPNFASIVKNF